MPYEITVTDEQARVLQEACELYARMAMGQFSFLAEMPQLAGLASDLRMRLMPGGHRLGEQPAEHRPAAPGHTPGPGISTRSSAAA